MAIFGDPEQTAKTDINYFTAADARQKRDNAVYERVCMENGHNFTEAFSTGTAFCSRCGQSLASVQG